jgi:7-keto-8-aminopelargonate synthetase-like enzyme
VDIDHSPVLQSPPGARVIIDGREYLYFAGTSYLGLAGRPEVIEAACEAVRRYGVHTATSRTGFGNNPPTLAVEHLAAQFFGTEDAFYFVSGYVGNHILIQGLGGGSAAVFIDELSHYSLKEAARLAGLPIIPFRHRDPEDLGTRLSQSLREGQRPLLMTDGVFPMTGAIAPVDEYHRVLQKFKPAAILIDDAHGMGVLGANGRGTLEHLKLWRKQCNGRIRPNGVLLCVCGTMSKAMGGFGGIIPGSRSFVDRARRSSHYFDGASAPPSAAAGATAKALELVMREPDLRHRLRENAGRMRRNLRELGLAVDDWPTPNIGMQIGSAGTMRRIHKELKARGILVPYIANYAGAGKEGLLRIAVFATHTIEMIDLLVAELRRVL